MSVYSAFRPLAFALDPETAHHLTFRMLRAAPHLCAALAPGVPVNAHRYGVSAPGMSWTFPIGVAAGLDKDAKALSYFSRIGFGAIEAGTLTPRPQPGNARPRIFRYPELRSLRNSMGFPNGGVEDARPRLQAYRGDAALGLNCGKNKDTPVQESARDYRAVFEACSDLVDYVVFNLSSPNTTGASHFQSPEGLSEILASCEDVRRTSRAAVFVKISPNLTAAQVEEIFNLAGRFRLNGIIATNTSVMPSYGAGGMSGEILLPEAARVRNQLLEMNAGRADFQIVGCGGFSAFEDVLDFWKRGGRFVQIYSAFIFQGPGFLRRVRDGIESLLARQGADRLQDLFDQGYFHT